MPFTLLDADPPDGLAGPGFLLRPILASDAELDYAAVMESRVELRPWEQTGWPADDFTVEANRRDLEMLQRGHEDRTRFTYTVLDSSGTECLGCVYVMPPDARSFVKPGVTIAPVGDGDRRWEDYGAAVYFWVRTSRLAMQLDRALLDALRMWFAQDWKLGRVLFVINEQATQQVSTVESAGLQLRFTIAEPGKPGNYLAYE
ncbi:MAG: hypothetical protein QM589_14565 [Thermomicrobiales bacterium]